MTSDTRDRGIDQAIAASLALFPLLSTGPTYFGLDWPWALEGFFLLFVTAGLLFLLVDRRRTPSAGTSHVSEPVRLLRRGYLIWLIPVAAATLLGLVERTPFDWTGWRVEADGLIGRLARPMNQAVDPFYPLRVGLTCLEGGLMFWVLSALLARTGHPSRRTKAAIHGCLWGITLVSVVAIVQYVTRANLHEYWVRMNPNLTRSHATLDDPNALASYLVLGIGLASGVGWSASNGRPPAATAAVTALALVALVTTVSRAGWAGLGFAGLTCIALLPAVLVPPRSVSYMLRRGSRGLGLILIAAALLWTAAFVTLPKRTTPLASTPWEAALQTVDPREPLESILKGRQRLWRAGLDLARSHWAIGAGLGAYPRFLGTYPGSDGPENAHDYFIQVLAEAGTIGLSALVLFLFAIALAVWPSSEDRDTSRIRLSVGLSVGFLAFVLTWITGHPLMTLSNQLWQATVLAVAVAAMDETMLPPSRKWLLHRGWVSGVLLVTAVAAGPRVVAAVRSAATLPYAAGVHDWEPGPPTEGAPADTRFRWTRGRAALREPVRGTVLRIPFYVARPLPATVRATIGGVAIDPITFSRTGWQTQSYDLVALLGEQRWRSVGTIIVELDVTPVFIPAQSGKSTDRRELGVGLGVVSWSSGDGTPRAAP